MRFILLYAFVYFFISVSGQDKSNSILFNTKAHYGFIIAHHRELRDVSKTNPWGFELETAWQLMTEDTWQYCYCYPKVGFSFFYINFDNPNVLGSSYALYPFVEPVINAEKNWNLYMRFGAGPNYLNKVYDSLSNPQNTFYSSHVSFVVALGIGTSWRIKENFELKAGANFNHISNGGIKMPNKGINFPTLYVGADYNLRPKPFVDYTRNKTLDLTPRDKWFELTTFISAKTDIKGYARYLVYGFNAGFYKVFGRLNAYNLNVEWVNDYADKREIERLNLTKNGEFIDYRYGAAYLGYNLLLGKFRFSFQLGAYFYSPFDRGDPIFQRYGINFLLFDRVNLGVNLKAERHVADLLDFRLGIII